jgi:hypothetical protein
MWTAVRTSANGKVVFRSAPELAGPSEVTRFFSSAG